ncbi:alkylphosphonate utilization protein [Rhodovulum adriaticum]|uniref:Protein PhnA n=1 Tax=Rhodovulum adriaticum TaxID=35804 RepID=A0A4R2NJV4_RHOAD|nr:alkylphosphonate utilization protein [Rhodovulum adriaticum]MBK1634694.1 PhnA protein [Rhodovulum adriaticum]TCP21598.1 protein PhnA [Rhodovulum adriaticum]
MQTCSLCGAEGATDYTVGPREDVIALCDTCRAGVEQAPQDAPHWQCLHEAVWSTEPAVQVVAYRVLKRLVGAPWAHELLEIAYLEPDVLTWAEAGLSDDPEVIHRDTNGAVLAAGDTVTLIKDLPVKGAGFTAKRGTAVRNIALVPDNAAHIEGRVEGQRIVILTEFVKKS